MDVKFKYVVCLILVSLFLVSCAGPTELDVDEAMEGLTIGYRVGNHREKKAPLDVIELLGRAYHKNYEFGFLTVEIRF